jgi:hypothetical protein
MTIGAIRGFFAVDRFQISGTSKLNRWGVCSSSCWELYPEQIRTVLKYYEITIKKHEVSAL